MSLPESTVSYWIASTPETSFPPLEGRQRADVVVIGGGIVGISTAFLLTRAGKRVVLLDLKRILRGTTGYTTAKLTAGHGLVYEHLEQHFGSEGAAAYAASNQAAIEDVMRLVEELGIDCDFRRTDNYVYTESPDEVASLEREAAAARRAGLAADLVVDTPLPYPVAAAVRHADQAEFHPRRFLLALAERLEAEGGRIHEHTRALDVERGRPCRVLTDRGIVEAADVVVATHLPFLDRGLFFAKAHPHRGYALGLPMPAADAPDGMHLTASQPTRSIRTTPLADGRRLLILGGEGHRTGELTATDEPYRRLAEFARERFGLDEVAYRWSTHDLSSVDRVPYVGRLRRREDRIWTATGFGGWGMSGGIAAAGLLRDLVLGERSPWAALYDAKRLKPKASGPTFAKENAVVARDWVGDRLRRRTRVAADLGRGEAAVLGGPARPTAVHRDGDGTLHAVSAVCTHLGCIVRWNGAERTWDCPCHGSRFTVDGEVIEGPATRDLPRADAERADA